MSKVVISGSAIAVRGSSVLTDDNGTECCDCGGCWFIAQPCPCDPDAQANYIYVLCDDLPGAFGRVTFEADADGDCYYINDDGPTVTTLPTRAIVQALPLTEHEDCADCCGNCCPCNGESCTALISRNSSIIVSFRMWAVNKTSRVYACAASTPVINAPGCGNSCIAPSGGTGGFATAVNVRHADVIDITLSLPFLSCNGSQVQWRRAMMLDLPPNNGLSPTGAVITGNNTCAVTVTDCAVKSPRPVAFNVFLDCNSWTYTFGWGLTAPPFGPIGGTFPFITNGLAVTPCSSEGVSLLQDSGCLSGMAGVPMPSNQRPVGMPGGFWFSGVNIGGQCFPVCSVQTPQHESIQTFASLSLTPQGLFCNPEE